MGRPSLSRAIDYVRSKNHGVPNGATNFCIGRLQGSILIRGSVALKEKQGDLTKAINEFDRVSGR